MYVVISKKHITQVCVITSSSYSLKMACKNELDSTKFQPLTCKMVLILDLKPLGFFANNTYLLPH